MAKRTVSAEYLASYRPTNWKKKRENRSEPRGKYPQMRQIKIGRCTKHGQNHGENGAMKMIGDHVSTGIQPGSGNSLMISSTVKKLPLDLDIFSWWSWVKLGMFGANNLCQIICQRLLGFWLSRLTPKCWDKNSGVYTQGIQGTLFTSNQPLQKKLLGQSSGSFSLGWGRTQQKAHMKHWGARPKHTRGCTRPRVPSFKA